MKVRLRMFAILRERSGVSDMELELADGATVGVAMEEVGRRFGAIKELLPRAAAAVNLSYAKAGALLHNGDELALIPPVSGG
ncbi:MAG TPA: MoaD/ThiS family protein [Tepidisphaeraceae bacterium]|jgi:molybdopterin converting factor subunit 1